MEEKRDVVADLLNTTFMPTDAGEYTDGIMAILRRIPDGWGRAVRVSRGWYPIIVDLDTRLATIDPEYKVWQVKQKYGGLRYYIESSNWEDRELEDRLNDLVETAEDLSYRTCEWCGTQDSTVDARHLNAWIATLCDSCTATA